MLVFKIEVDGDGIGDQVPLCLPCEKKVTNGRIVGACAFLLTRKGADYAIYRIAECNTRAAPTLKKAVAQLAVVEARNWLALGLDPNVARCMAGIGGELGYIRRREIVS